MSKPYIDNGQAAVHPLHEGWQTFGLSKREYFAGQAMQALVTGAPQGASAKVIASEAVKMADLLLWQLEQKIEN